jgi:hypothetical protein
LVTRNLRHFRQIPGMRVVNWVDWLSDRFIKKNSGVRSQNSAWIGVRLADSAAKPCPRASE